MSRSKWKGGFLKTCLLSKNLYNNSKRLKKICIKSRNSIIPYFLINKQVFVHNGKDFKKITITREKVGFKFGEFVYTKNKKHGSKSKSKLNKKNKQRNSN